MAALPPDVRNNFGRDYGLAQQDVKAGVVSSRAQGAEGHWKTWLAYCSELGINPTLQEFQDPIPILQVFIRRYRIGEIAPSKRQVRSRTVEDALRSVGQAFATVGSPDPRLNSQGNIDFRIQRQLACYTKQDPPPNRVKPIPVPILMHILSGALASQIFPQIAIANMITLAFFFLLRPGEYTGTRNEYSAPFRLCDVSLKSGHQTLNIWTASDNALLAATSCTLEFTTQKNAVRGEVIALSRSGNPQFCPVRCLVQQVIHLRSHGAPADTPIATYWHNNRFVPIKPADITDSLRAATNSLGPLYGFLPKDISARSLRASGAMALLCAQVDSDIIRLLGRWRSDEMLRYLHVQAEPVMRHFSSRMITGGNFTLHPNSEVPVY
jgi:hypothetical protein